MHLHICKQTQRQLPTCNIQICVLGLFHPFSRSMELGARSLLDSELDWDWVRSQSCLSAFPPTHLRLLHL